MSEKFLNEDDKALHDAIHDSMLKEDPSKLLDKGRIDVLKLVENAIGVPYGDVADVGCGNGYFGIYVAKNYNKVDHVDAIEASEIAVDKVIPRNVAYYNVKHKVKSVLGSFDELPPQKYDFVFAMGALHHSTNLVKTLRSISASLNEGGYLVAQEPVMPDETTHQQYDFKYNIVEERFGLKIRNGDRFDRFFRECEYKSALVKAGFDMIMWDDFPKKSNNYGLGVLRTLFLSLKSDGVKPTLNKILNKLFRMEVSESEPIWQINMNKATVNVMPKVFIAQKSNCSTFYHND
tara:strand:- start:2912 stop:3784 length:873 start_codon:yes stop_codon:yes gene_type:complete